MTTTTPTTTSDVPATQTTEESGNDEALFMIEVRFL